MMFRRFYLQILEKSNGERGVNHSIENFPPCPTHKHPMKPRPPLCTANYNLSQQLAFSFATSSPFSPRIKVLTNTALYSSVPSFAVYLSSRQPYSPPSRRHGSRP
ncbi:unnamed protein product [Chondrus crispus]|uniref:Uncharacterized protein n=1 Tax=Chondrus crispus TaxID=2769 RepID=R7Q420_CHOCR|nr:unnamed protein product [Chondrus crispus]CDF32613.1 unnamed protein product [Chondrus crispus]|eukprot:XP_005712384.1 unnamed protein product [Chondrus crispus]